MSYLSCPLETQSSFLEKWILGTSSLPLPAPLHGGCPPWVIGTYLEVLEGEEALRLGPLHPEGCLTSTFFLNPLGLTCTPHAMFWILGGQRHRACRVCNPL